MKFVTTVFNWFFNLLQPLWNEEDGASSKTEFGARHDFCFCDSNTHSYKVSVVTNSPSARSFHFITCFTIACISLITLLKFLLIGNKVGVNVVTEKHATSKASVADAKCGTSVEMRDSENPSQREECGVHLTEEERGVDLTAALQTFTECHRGIENVYEQMKSEVKLSGEKRWNLQMEIFTLKEKILNLGDLLNADAKLNNVIESECSNSSLDYSDVNDNISIYFWDKETLFKDVKVIKPLGEGTYGKVDLVTYKEQLCVLKTMLRGQVSMKELKNIAHLDGAGGAPKLVAATKDAFLSTYAGNLNMKELIWDETRSQDFLLRGALSVARKVKEINECGLVHNDLKSDNIMYNEETDEYSVINFGLSTWMGDRPYNVTGPAEFERMDWVTPEVKLGGPATDASDIYSLGILLSDIISEFKTPDSYALDIIERATDQNPTKRPAIEDFINILERKSAGNGYIYSELPRITSHNSAEMSEETQTCASCNRPFKSSNKVKTTSLNNSLWSVERRNGHEKYGWEWCDNVYDVDAKNWAKNTVEELPRSGFIDFCDRDTLFKDTEIIRPLGEGAFGKVDLVVYKKQFCVLKTMLRGQVSMKELKNLVHLDGAGGAPKLVAATKDAFLSTYVGNLNMNELIWDGTRSQDFLLRGALSVTRKVREIHECGLAHNDLKGDNIMYNEETDEYSVIDFGLSTPMGARPFPAMDPHDYQRMDWIAPELKRGEPVTEASDIYSLGILLIDIVTGFRTPSYWALVAIGKATQMDPIMRPSIDELSATLKGDFDDAAGIKFSMMASEKFPFICAESENVSQLNCSVDGWN